MLFEPSVEEDEELKDIPIEKVLSVPFNQEEWNYQFEAKPLCWEERIYKFRQENKYKLWQEEKE